MIAARASLNQAFERASHQASGVATTSTKSVEMVASSIVSLIGTQMSGDRPSTPRSLGSVAELRDDRGRFRTLEESEESLRRLAVRSRLQEHRVLTDRRMEVFRNLPPRPLRD